MNYGLRIVLAIKSSVFLAMFSRCQGGGRGDDVNGVGPVTNIASVYRTDSFNPLPLTLSFCQGSKKYSSSLRSP